jgi:Tol biopolymer transport system component
LAFGHRGWKVGLNRPLAVLACVAGLLALAVPAQAAFPGKNGRIAFAVPREDNPYRSRAETIGPDGSGRALLPITLKDGSSLAGIYEPTWSPDGTRITFGGLPGEASGFPYLYTADADGSNAIAMTDPYQEPRDPAWSRDGSKIAFAKKDDFSQFWATELKSINSDGTGLTTIREISLGEISYPDWSPVRDEIAYVDDGYRCDYSGWFPSCNLQIWIITPDGTRLAKLGDDKGNDYQPSWSPDGTKIAFMSTRDQSNSWCDWSHCGDIYAMNADGTATTRLTDSPGGDSQPVWSPDGKKIAFVSLRDDPDPIGCISSNCHTDIYVMNADGSGQTNLTNTTTKSERSPDWQALPFLTPTDNKNAAKFCKAERERLGESGFRQRYGTNANGSNAFGKCVSENTGK